MNIRIDDVGTLSYSQKIRGILSLLCFFAESGDKRLAEGSNREDFLAGVHRVEASRSRYHKEANFCAVLV